jgi:hypothetical protein
MVGVKKIKGMFVASLIHVDWVVLSRFKFKASQNLF